MSNYLIVGLGNIGREYENTRHNIGFDVLDELAKQQDCSFSLERLGYKTDFRFKGRTLNLVKPTTYMNLSGKSVRYWLQTCKVPVKNLLVIVDDKALPFGKLRLKPKGSDGGHNGLKHINQIFGNNLYARLRFGIGSNFSRGKQVQYVLGKWSEEEKAGLHEPIKKSIDIIKSFTTIGIERTMNTHN